MRDKVIARQPGKCRQVRQKFHDRIQSWQGYMVATVRTPSAQRAEIRADRLRARVAYDRRQPRQALRRGKRSASPLSRSATVPSTPQGGRSDCAAGFANHQRCRANEASMTADLPLAGGDVRQDREGRCPAGIPESHWTQHALVPPGVCWSLFEHRIFPESGNRTWRPAYPPHKGEG